MKKKTLVKIFVIRSVVGMGRRWRISNEILSPTTWQSISMCFVLVKKEALCFTCLIKCMILGFGWWVRHFFFYLWYQGCTKEKEKKHWY